MAPLCECPLVFPSLHPLLHTSSIVVVVQTLYTTIIICYSQGEGQEGALFRLLFTVSKLAKNIFPTFGQKSGQVLCENTY